ncbi:MAG TPA: twin-arginine translocation signal domain-containing protein, partial [Agromyces sp.]|nr:twin-arginine translocation signal domain-containing protein [Agromyces sp.]
MAEAGDETGETGQTDAQVVGSTRRDFLKFGGVAAAGAVVGGAAGAAAGAAIGHSLGFSEGAEDFTSLTPREKAGFDHLVVVMGENRSFDNLLGYLYTADDLPEGETFEGLAFGDHQNTAPDGTVVAAHVYEGSTDEIMGRP